jgi:Na+/phosphate symporter
MEEKELALKFHEVFEYAIPILENVKRAFLTDKEALLKESKAKFRDMLKSRVTSAEKLVGEKEKDEIEKKYISLLPSLQSVALATENLINKMETKAESRILFSDKALSEIRELFGLMLVQFRNTMDYVLTKNPHLKDNIGATKEKIASTSAEYELIHQQRLIAGVCMPKASYLYIDISESIKRISRGLAEFSEKV